MIDCSNLCFEVLGNVEFPVSNAFFRAGQSVESKQACLKWTVMNFFTTLPTAQIHDKICLIYSNSRPFQVHICMQSMNQSIVHLSEKIYMIWRMHVLHGLTQILTDSTN